MRRVLASPAVLPASIPPGGGEAATHSAAAVTVADPRPYRTNQASMTRIGASHDDVGCRASAPRTRPANVSMS